MKYRDRHKEWWEKFKLLKRMGLTSEQVDAILKDSEKSKKKGSR